MKVLDKENRKNQRNVEEFNYNKVVSIYLSLSLSLYIYVYSGFLFNKIFICKSM